MDGVKLHLGDDGWESRGGVHASGRTFHDGDLLEARELVDLFAGTPTGAFAGLARELNGLFSVVSERDEAVIVVSDRIGSRALFYRPDEPFRLGDSFGEIRAHAGGESIPEARRLEFLMGTYVSGRDTLDPSIEKTLPGTVLRVDLETGSVSEEQYYSYCDDPQPARYDEDHYPAWKETLHETFERLVEVLDGRQAAVALSGGYDSRLIATMLDRVGYENVVLFTYTGIQDGSHEAAVAREVAADVGFDWVEMELTREGIREAHDSALWHEIVRAIGSSGMSHTHPVEVVIQEGLESMDAFDDDAMRLNGHQLFEAGAYVPARLFRRTGTVDPGTIVDAIFEKHYKRHDFDESAVEAVKRRLGRVAGVDGALPAEEAFRTVERWYWCERLPNFLSMRTLLRMDFDVWYPLLDGELLGFWNRLSVADRYDRRAYDAWVDRLYEETYGRRLETAGDLKRAEQRAQSSGLERLFWIVRYSALGERIGASRLRPVASVVAGLVRSDDDADPAEVYRRDPLLAFVEEERFVRAYSGTEDFRYFLADEILETLDQPG